MAQVHLLFLLEESPDGCYSLFWKRVFSTAMASRIIRKEGRTTASVARTAPRLSPILLILLSAVLGLAAYGGGIP